MKKFNRNKIIEGNELFYYGDNYRDAIANGPINIPEAKTLNEYCEHYNTVCSINDVYEKIREFDEIEEVEEFFEQNQIEDYVVAHDLDWNSYYVYYNL